MPGWAPPGPCRRAGRCCCRWPRPIGPALHLSNSLIDVDTDAADPAGGLAGRLGRRRSLAVLALLLVVVYGLAWAAVASTVARRHRGRLGTGRRGIV